MYDINADEKDGIPIDTIIVNFCEACYELYEGDECPMCGEQHDPDRVETWEEERER